MALTPWVIYSTPPVLHGNTPLHSSLLCLGTGVIRHWWVVLLHLGTPRGNPPSAALYVLSVWVYVCLCVCVPTEREECHHWAPCHCASSPLPRTPPPPVLACTLTYSWSRFGDMKIKAFLCFSVFPLSLQCHQSAECCCPGCTHRELIQTDTITFHFCCVISQSSECPPPICPPYSQQLCTGSLMMLENNTLQPCTVMWWAVPSKVYMQRTRLCPQ